jgi:hypothetical protein
VTALFAVADDEGEVAEEAAAAAAVAGGSVLEAVEEGD